MESEDKIEIFKDIVMLQNEHKAFKRRVSILANLFIPGVGFYLYDNRKLKAIITFLLFIVSLSYFVFLIAPITDIAWLYSIPTIVIWLVSTLLVAFQD